MGGRIITGLDIGTTKIGVIIGEVNEDDEISIIGVGQSPSDGLRKGVVINIDKTVRAIAKAVNEAQIMAGKEVNEVYAGIAGGHIKSLNASGVVTISQEDNEITESDVDRVIESASAMQLARDRKIIHVIPQEFTIDDQIGIKEPVGMSGVKMLVSAHVVTAGITSAQNINKSVEKAGLVPAGLVLEPLASSYSVLSKDELELGVALIDMGGGTTDLAIFFEDSIRDTSVVGLGGKNLTSDIAIGIRTPAEKAEEIKIKHGIAMQSLAKKEEYIDVPGIGGRESREISRDVLGSIIEPRLEEIFNLINREIKKSEFAQMLGAGVVITGGGSLMEGLAEFAEQIFEMPVRVGTPQGLKGLTDAVSSPIHSTGTGLVIYGQRNSANDEIAQDEGREDLLGDIVNKAKSLFKRYF